MVTFYFVLPDSVFLASFYFVLPDGVVLVSCYFVLSDGVVLMLLLKEMNKALKAFSCRIVSWNLKELCRAGFTL